MVNADGAVHHPIDTFYLIDDCDDEAFLAKRLMKRATLQATIKAFSTLAEFLAYAEKQSEFRQHDCLVIVDLYLDIELGTDVIPRITSLYPDLIVGMSTGSEDPKDRQNALQAGASFYAGKPLDRTCVESICEQVNSLELVETADGLVIFRNAN